MKQNKRQKPEFDVQEALNSMGRSERMRLEVTYEEVRKTEDITLEQFVRDYCEFTFP